MGNSQEPNRRGECGWKSVSSPRQDRMFVNMAKQYHSSHTSNWLINGRTMALRPSTVTGHLRDQG